MSKVCSAKEAYFKGMDYWKKDDYKNARYWLEIAYKDPEFKNLALSKLMHIDLREGKYAKVRKLLEDNPQSNTIKFKRMYGLLESIENNFETSKKYYNECMIEPKMQNIAFLSIAKLYIQTGDNEIARKMIETLQLNQKFYNQATISLICLDILEKKYMEGYELLNTIDERMLNTKLKQHYKILYYYLLNFLGKLNTTKNNIDPETDYMIYRLFDMSDEALLQHVKKHLNQAERDTNGCFFKYTDLEKLLSDVRKQIENMNPNHFEISDMYRFRLDTLIGFKEDVITSDICVTTIIGTKNIMTMYPVLLSDQFDREGMSTSQQLLLKRSQGGKKL